MTDGSMTASSAVQVRPRAARRSQGRAFTVTLTLVGLAISALLAAIFVSLLLASRPAIMKNGLGFLAGTTWDPVTGVFQALPFVVGTLASSFLALAIAAVLSL